MSLFGRKEIETILNTDYRNALEQFGDDRLFGVFLYGKANKDTVFNAIEIETVTIYFPSLEDIAINNTMSLNWNNTKLGNRNCQIDFRLIINLLNNKITHFDDIFSTYMYVINSKYQQGFNQLKKQVGLIDISKWFPLTSSNVLVTGWTKIFETYIQYQGNVQDEFFDNLTQTEEKALIFCLEEIGAEGDISIHQAVADSHISRTVFKSLIEKLNFYKAAEISGHGVRGTHIKFRDFILSRFYIGE